MDSIQNRSGLTFSKSERLARSADFSEAFAHGQWGVHRVVRVVIRGNQTKLNRFGFAVSKRFGNAVRRNLIKRHMREAIRHIKSELPQGFDFVLLPSKFTPNPGFAELCDVLPRLVKKTVRRLEKRSSKA